MGRVGEIKIETGTLLLPTYEQEKKQNGHFLSVCPYGMNDS